MHARRISIPSRFGGEYPTLPTIHSHSWTTGVPPSRTILVVLDWLHVPGVGDHPQSREHQQRHDRYSDHLEGEQGHGHVFAWAALETK